MRILDRNGGVLLSPSGPREKNGILSDLAGGHLMTGTEQQKEPNSNSWPPIILVLSFPDSWSKEDYYSTIRTAVVPFLLGRRQSE
jgi:hypothetical protein